MAKQIYVIDGNEFSTLDKFYDVISRVLIPGSEWGRNLNAFNDILRGGFGTPEDGFVLRWKNSSESRRRLGYPETVRQLELVLTNCEPSIVEWLTDELKRAQEGQGPTIFDWLVEIIERHCLGGEEQQDNVELLLD